MLFSQLSGHMEISELYDFEDRSTDIMTTLSNVWTSVIDANNMKAPSITPVIWSFTLIDRLKVDTDGAANGSLGLAGCWGIFRQVEVSHKVASLLLLAVLLPTKGYWWLL
ncbi:hypothetical protein TIFTF001_048238 [Ficus carica]|uniref:Uncharacterized protein n=1 Tax=Ficus carica TaxID=3494 RepID=A0AA88CSE8_FICCA|nr:hypothetical protein TIFTF001_048238 [Ficus carica]